MIGLCLFSPLLLADDVAVEAPDLAFLEFLGEWSGESEAWLDTQHMDDLAVEQAVVSEVHDEE